MTDAFPVLNSVVLDTTDARGLAEFYRHLLGYEYRPGDEPPPAGEPDPSGHDWLILRDPNGPGRLGFQQVESLPPTTWPDAGIPQQLHLDLRVPSADELGRQRDRVQQLGGEVRHDRFADPQEPLYVFADPAGHPFCIFVAAEPGTG